MISNGRLLTAVCQWRSRVLFTSQRSQADLTNSLLFHSQESGACRAATEKHSQRVFSTLREGR